MPLHGPWFCIDRFGRNALLFPPMSEVALASLDPRLQKLIENTRVALERGNLDYAIEACTQILKAAPGCLVARKLQRAAQLRKFKTRSRLMAKALGSMTSAGFLLGNVRKDPVKAMAAAEKILAGDPTSIAGLRILAEAAAAQHMPETAAFAYEALREYEPDNIDNLMKLGEALFEAGKVADAIHVADAVLKANGTHAEALDLMRKASIAQATAAGHWDEQGTYREKLKDEGHAVSLEQSAKLMTAEEMSERLIQEALVQVEKEPENLLHYKNLVHHYRQMGDLDAALDWVRRARSKTSGQTDVALEKQEIELQTALLTEELRQAERAHHALPGDRSLHAALEASKKKLLDYELNQAKSMVDRYPSDLVARHKLGELYYASGSMDLAIAQFQHSQKSPQTRIQSLLALGRCFRGKKLFDLAEAQLLAAKAEVPETNDLKKEIHYALGECYQEMDRREDAIAEFKAIYAEDIGYRDVAARINTYYSSR